MSTVVTEKSISARIADRLVHSIGQRRYKMWFDRSVRLDYHDRHHRLDVAVPNQFVADWIGRHFKGDLQQAAQHELGDSVGLEVRVDADLFPKNEDRGAADDPVVQPQPQVGQCVVDESMKRSTGWARSGLRYHLKDFVVGPSNELAFSAANRAVEEGDHAINPLFIHGGCGLGKTHLLQGLCRKVLQQKPHARVLYTTGEQFTNEFLTGIRTNKIDRFRKNIRRLDFLAIDDVHFLANKQATQQEFLHSFDAIELGGARVVLASDCHPTLIRQFSEALVSRCVRGMVVQVHQPDLATRVEMIRVLARRRGLTLLDTAVDALASRCVGSVRELEGALTKLHALVCLTTKRRSTEARKAADGADAMPQIGNTLIDQLFNHKHQYARKTAVRFETILSVVAEQFKIEQRHLLGNNRHKQIVLARSLVIHLARQMTMMSYTEIALAMGRRTHSTIITAAKRIEKQIAENPVLILPSTLEHTSLVELVERLKHAIYRA